ncbi:hypothetical protein J5X84_36125 [Streptosporangiaceae bacterium NEAU-GS5]|nr:hypothetical protein [Streptosporangiaceae bacterium NEAU-GS5]
MAKQGGLGDNAYVAGFNLSGDITSLSRIGGGPNPWEVTGIDKSAKERIGLLRDGAIEFASYFNPARAHPVLSDLPYTDVMITYCRGTSLGSPGAGLISKQIGYDGNRGDDGSFTFNLEAQANGYGIEWGRQGTAGIRTDTSATNGSSIDGAAASDFGLQAYLQVFAVTGTSVTVKLQESSDDGGGDAWADVVGGGFTAATGVTTQRIATAGDLTVERYLRVVSSGTFSNAQFSVLIVRNPIAVTF